MPSLLEEIDEQFKREREERAIEQVSQRDHAQWSHLDEKTPATTAEGHKEKMPGAAAEGQKQDMRSQLTFRADAPNRLKREEDQRGKVSLFNVKGAMGATGAQMRPDPWGFPHLQVSGDEMPSAQYMPTDLLPEGTKKSLTTIFERTKEDSPMDQASRMEPPQAR